MGREGVALSGENKASFTTRWGAIWPWSWNWNSRSAVCWKFTWCRILSWYCNVFIFEGRWRYLLPSKFWGISEIRGAFHSKKSRTPLAKILLFARKIHQKSVKILLFWKNLVRFSNEWNAPRRNPGNLVRYFGSWFTPRLLHCLSVLMTMVWEGTTFHINHRENWYSIESLKCLPFPPCNECRPTLPSGGNN